MLDFLLNFKIFKVSEFGVFRINKKVSILPPMTNHLAGHEQGISLWQQEVKKRQVISSSCEIAFPEDLCEQEEITYV